MLMQTGDLSKCLNLRISFPGSSSPDLHRKSTLNLFFFKVGSKYVFFPVPAGTTPEAKTFDEADADCTSKGATLAYPEDDVENAAIIYFLTEHFGGDPAAVANGLGAWLGIIKPDGVQNFTYHDTGEIASYTPFLARFSFARHLEQNQHSIRRVHD